MALYAQDIDEKILNAVNAIFLNDLQTVPLAINDTLALKTLKQAPLQDDPTLVAPFVVYNNCDGSTGMSIRLIKHGHEEAEYGGAEIGGPIRYLYCYECAFGTPRATTRDRARADGSALMSRIIQSLIYHADLSDVLAEGMLISGDGTKYVEGQNNRLVTNAGYDIYGGENEFYGKGKVYWQYPVSWNVITRF